ncbi:MAG: hypothetical protein WA913_13860, partial [Pricia sp.]
QRQQELVSFEKKMIAQSEALSALVDSVSDGLPKGHKKALEGLQSTFEQELSEYSSTPDTAKKLNFARDLTECFSQMALLARDIAALPNRQKELEELYQDAVWNPFMATVMKEEVKKRIKSAYRKVLVPYFLERATTIDCQNIEQLLNEMAFVDKRMQQLRKEDTRKMERKLRRVDDPQRILKLIGPSEKIDTNDDNDED